MIPRVAHVIWVGGAPMPEKEAACLERNRQVLSHYDLLLWGDDDIAPLSAGLPEIARFFEHARANRKWAFMADAMKMLILVRFGGWVLDADNEFLQPPDAFERLHWVSGFENWNGLRSPITAVMGAVPDHRFSRLLASAYEKTPPAEICSVPNTRWISNVLYKHGMNRENRRQYVEALDVEIFPDFVFCGPAHDGQTVALHHFSASWKAAA
jgi:mannosyltransferase OCH1-like enzyme